MINLFFITYDFSGVRTYTNELLGYLSQQPGIAVHRIFLESKDHKEYTVVREANIINIYFPFVRREPGSLGRYAVRCMDLLFPVVRDKEQLIFHLNNSLHVKLGLEARKRFGAKLIYTLHFLPNYFSYMGLDDINPEEIIPTGDALEREIIREADHIICVTRFAQKMVIDAFNISSEKIVAIHNGLGSATQSAVHISKTNSHLKNELGFRKSEQIILFVGRLEERKGLKYLLKAFNHISGRNPGARLIIVGDGNFKESLAYMECNLGKITFTGEISTRELSVLYRIATIGVIPSIFEQCSYVALEMMQYGLPIVVSGAPGLSELFTNNQNALIVPVHKSANELIETEIDELQLAESLETLLNNDALRQKLGECARIQWEQHHTAKSMGETIIQQYKKQLKDKTNQQKEEGQKVNS